MKHLRKDLFQTARGLPLGCIVFVMAAIFTPGIASAVWTSPTGHTHGTGWSNGDRARDNNTTTFASHAPASGWGGWLTFSFADTLWSDRFRVHSDFGYGEVDSVQIEVSLDNAAWTTVHRGTILDATWDTKIFTAQFARHARFRYHRVTTSYTFWLYEFQLFETPTSIDSPTVLTTSPTSIDEQSAVVHGTLVDDGGEPSSLRFQYGLTTSYELGSTPWIPDYVSGNTAGIMLTGLSPSTTYHYRVQGMNSTATVDGADSTFTTAPLVAPGWVSPTSWTDATGRWEDNPNIYDDEVGSFAKCFHNSGDPNGVWSPYIYLNHDSIGVDSIRFYAKDDANINQAQIQISADGVTWQTVYDAAFPNKTWIEAPAVPQWVTQARARFRVNSNGVGLYWEFFEFDMHITARPALAVIDSQWVTEGDTLSLDVSAIDFAGDSLALSALNLPTNAGFTDSTNGAGVMTFAPDLTQAGVYNVTFVAADSALADSQVVVVTVNNLNQPPALALIDSQWVAEGDTLTFGASATDFDGDSLVFSGAGLPANTTVFDSTNGAGSVTFAPDFTQAGVHNITVIVSDGALADSQVVWVTVTDVNRPPALAVIDSQWVDEGDTLLFGANATDPDGDSLVLAAVNLPANATFTDSTNGAGSTTFLPDFTQAGVYGVTYIAADTSFADSQIVWITVTDVNRPPALAVIDSQWVAEGDTLLFGANATDPDGDSLVLSAAGLPANAGFVDSTNGAGSATFTPDFTQAGVYGVTVIAADTSFADSQVVWITVTDVNRPPALAVIDSQWVDEGDTLTFAANASDPDGDSLVLSAAGLPVNAGFVDSTNGAGSATFTPDFTQAGVYGVTVIAADTSFADSQVVWITVSDVNRAPVLAVIDSQWVDEGDTLTFTANATDPDGDSLVLSAAGLPVNAGFVDSTNGAGNLLFTPTLT
ncbi:MAG: tandem-95 repeat protein, partial [Gemmatimonadetes bacterium]|nr:tandem-95 repeat protein [Gemmatimonadota bacterium]